MTWKQSQQCRLLLLLILSFTLLPSLFAELSFPNPEINATACRGDNTTSRVCDPDGMLRGLKQRRFIQQDIVQFERLNVSCMGKDIPVQLAVFVEYSMSAPFRASLPARARVTAQHIHNEWGIGYQSDCGGTGLLIFLAVRDHQIYLSRGKALTPMLSNDRLGFVIGKMKPLLQKELYGDALDVGIRLLSLYLQGRRPGWEEGRQCLEIVGLCLGVFAVLATCCWCFQRKQKEWDRREQAKFENTLTNMDRDHASALQGQYKATSCPICLEDFVGKEENVNNEKKALLDEGGIARNNNLLGSDRKPLKLLICGHVFDQKCWEEFAEHAGQPQAENITCPICRHPVQEATTRSATPKPTTTTTTTWDTYRQERNFRVQRLRQRYPDRTNYNYTRRWDDADYSGSMLLDYQCYRRDEARRREAARQARESRSRSRGSTSTSRLGGGRADGGGVGGSW